MNQLTEKTTLSKMQNTPEKDQKVANLLENLWKDKVDSQVEQ